MLAGMVARHTEFWARLGDLETESIGPRLSGIEIRHPVYITGLARAGSTMLLRILSLVPGVSTHRYSDYPFLFTPWWHHRFLSRLPQGPERLVERAHADGIRVGPESPEAMEEILWMHFFPGLHDPAADNRLAAVPLFSPFPCFYRNHMRKILLARSGSRYLAKNNYIFSRMRCILDLFPDARFLLLVRDPVSHVASLMKQQRLFSDRYRGDDRAWSRLRWMGHFEFGEVRRPLNLGDASGTREVIDHWAGGREVEGWSLYWRQVYGFISRLLESDEVVQKAVLVVRFESLCDAPGGTLSEIARHGLFPSGEEIARTAASTIRYPDYYNIEFTGGELKTIREITADVAKVFGYGSGDAPGRAIPKTENRS